MASVSYREYEIWNAYFELEMDVPSRSDYYMMQVAREIFTKDLKKHDANKVAPHDFRLSFSNTPKKKQAGALPAEEYQAQINRSIAMQRMGLDYNGNPLKQHKRIA